MVPVAHGHLRDERSDVAERGIEEDDNYAPGLGRS